ncbi:hypothetical protein NO357_12550 [Marimonas arenosa]|uniref:Uncharacterized protein n=2 Tax=Marimonas arenosa TaxID=1795305 RepID=A0AAE3WDJ5_9RHOB|nr:hypothetical protein [Marimonas arenosa]
MREMSELNGKLTTCSFVASWMVWVELADRDDARVRQAVVDAVGLQYGPYEGVAFESGPGKQFFQPKQGSKLGNTEEAVEMPARVLTFTVEGDLGKLAKAIEAVRHTHCYEEPVIIVQQVLASRADFSEDRENPNRWWNRGFEV